MSLAAGPFGVIGKARKVDDVFEIVNKIRKRDQDIMAKLSPENKKKFQALKDQKTFKTQKTAELDAEIKRLDDAVGRNEVRLRNQLTMQRQALEDEIMDLGKEIAELTK